MNLFSLYIKYSQNRNVKYFIYLFFTSFFLIGVLIFRDYGISTDELFQRASGFYWYLSIVNLFIMEFFLICYQPLLKKLLK